MKSELRFCPNCCQNVYTVSSIDHAAMAILLIAGIVPGIAYWLIYCDSSHCPLCHTPLRDLERPKCPEPMDEETLSMFLGHRR